MPVEAVELKANSEIVEMSDGVFGFVITLSGFPSKEEAIACSAALAEPFSTALIVALQDMHGHSDEEIQIN